MQKMEFVPFFRTGCPERIFIPFTSGQEDRSSAGSALSCRGRMPPSPVRSWSPSLKICRRSSRRWRRNTAPSMRRHFLSWRNRTMEPSCMIWGWKKMWIECRNAEEDDRKKVAEKKFIPAKL